MRQAITFALSILLLSTATLPVAAKTRVEDELINVVVTLNGDPSCSFLPENYVSFKSPTLDRTLEATSKKIEQNALDFANNNCDGMIVELHHAYGLLLKGFSCSIKKTDLERLRLIHGIKKVTVSPEYVLYDNYADAPLITGAIDTWSQKDSRGRFVTGVGQVIGIIDTGLDWRHPALGGKMGSGAKVLNGIDFSSGNGVAKDPQTHGTSVAGAAAGNGIYKGTAPDANLIGFKVYSDKEGASTDVSGNIIKAMEQAVNLKCTVVNLSLGTAGAKSGEEDAIDPFRNAVRAGLVVCASAGNNGARSDQIGFQVSSPSTIPQLISCAATDDTPHPVIKITKPDAAADMSITGTPFDNKEMWPAGDYEVVDAGFGSKIDFSSGDFNGKIALIMRGPVGKEAITFHEKAINAKNAGAIGCIIYNHSLSSYSGSMYPDDATRSVELIPAIAVTYSQGYKLKMMTPYGLKLKVVPGVTFGMMCDFTSMGPSTDLKFKPELAAPGLGVMTPVYMGETPDYKNPPYKPFSGTSCAAPVISGGCALVRQMNPNDPPLVIKSKLMSTATLLFNNKANEYIPLMLQGSGRMNVSKAIKTKQYFNPPSVALEADIKGKQTGEAFLFNDGGTPVEASLSYWSVGRNTTCDLPEKLSIPAKSQASFDFLVQSIEGSEDVLEGIIFAKIGDDTIHLPLIMSTSKIGISRRISDLRISKPVMNFSDTLPPTITYKINYGSFEKNSPGRDVTSNFAAGKVELSNIDETLGVVVFDDDMQVGYYHKQWDGHDFENRLFAPDGSYILKGIGLETITEGKWSAINNQSDPATTSVRIKNSPLQQIPFLKLKSIPSQPRVGEEFELRFVCSQFTGVNEIKFDFTWDQNIMEIVSALPETVFGKITSDVNAETKIDNENGKMTVSLKSALTKDCSGRVIAFKCKPRQDGQVKYTIISSVVDTMGGLIAPKEVYNSFNIVYGYSFYDLNKDGIVDELDSNLLMKLYHVSYQDTNYREDFDFNMDSVIDLIDMMILSKMFGVRMSPP